MAGQQRTPYFYYPFQKNWDAPRYWDFEMRRSPASVNAALEGYKRVLTNKSIYAQNWLGHPLATELIFRTGRWRMLETGLVLHQLKHLGEYQKRLLAAESYAETCAELRVALLLQRLGFKVVHEPSNQDRPVQSRTKGPDWLARHGGITFGVEVKCPRESEDLRSRTQLAWHITQQSQTIVGNQGVDMNLDPDVFEACRTGSWVDETQTDSWLLNSLVALEEGVANGKTLGSIRLAPEGFSSMIGPIPVNHTHETGRLRSILEAAAGQLAAWSPGVVAIDTSQDSSLMRRCCSIATMMGETWASGLGCVLLIADTGPGLVLTVIPGPRFKSLPPLQGRTCRSGHFHVRTFPGSEDCLIDPRFDELPAFCVPGVGHLSGLKQRKSLA